MCGKVKGRGVLLVKQYVFVNIFRGLGLFFYKLITGKILMGYHIYSFILTYLIHDGVPRIFDPNCMQYATFSK